MEGQFFSKTESVGANHGEKTETNKRKGANHPENTAKRGGDKGGRQVLSPIRRETRRENRDWRKNVDV